MFEFIVNLFGGSGGGDKGGDESSGVVANKSGLLCGFSYLFKKKRIRFDEQFSFTIHYLFNDEIWLAANAFAAGVGFSDPAEAVRQFVDSKYKCSLNQLVFNVGGGGGGGGEDNNAEEGLVCVNKHGVLQLLDQIDFDNKAEFMAWLIENVYAELENKFLPSPIDEKLNKMLTAVDDIKQHNDELARTNEHFKSQVIERIEMFDRRIAQLNDKMVMFENVDELYRRLREHHRTTTASTSSAARHLRHPSFLSASDVGGGDSGDIIGENGDLCRYETVRFPRDTSKHPRLSVFVKPSESGTQLAFVASQQRRHGVLKRKYNDMEMIYDSVHPNPQLAMQCINEELDMKNFDYRKQSRRTLHINCSVDTAKSLIHENL
ncbi:38.7K protein [Agrotis ipsilon multiple nucleopolyhedrovirus]|uniref:38.7K protein n=1 Tax=Agrotis ipsilon multiple nucleopolyhedrovirus TaxID=208013 RepID=B6D5T5_9ABAC|nr:38.7K protein [Agrotis ipsilon multiple nucleopolyhedrovirus]ACI28723.1 38.7K protein [Agrotis ipsilon multiple nucleopolyhedrovirus]